MPITSNKWNVGNLAMNSEMKKMATTQRNGTSSQNQK
jgi:hypothetical protein